MQSTTTKTARSNQKFATNHCENTIRKYICSIHDLLRCANHFLIINIIFDLVQNWYFTNNNGEDWNRKAVLDGTVKCPINLHHIKSSTLLRKVCLFTEHVAKQ